MRSCNIGDRESRRGQNVVGAGMGVHVYDIGLGKGEGK